MMEMNEIQAVLDEVQAGDFLSIVRSNGGILTSVVGGPALAAPGLDKAVGIDLLDGETHIVRQADGRVWGTFETITRLDGRVWGTFGPIPPSSRS